MEDKNLGKELIIIVNKIKRYVDKENQKHQVPFGQGRILRFLYTNKINGKTVYQSDLKDAFSVRGASITGIVDALVKQGFVARNDDSIDKRKKNLGLTPLGEEKAQIIIKSIDKFEKEIKNVFSKQEFNDFRNKLAKLEKWIDYKEKLENETDI
ncbi:MarR family winged helix-turn-helix transcriptional regulator [Haploplasma axanthum]|uniref:Transcriptional regulator SlyA n=1 Tax=Haploplasma axanthum TaxID=29552 RepID=A0A449BEZ4_HAPAX|nr:MarR family transcriptional regulator [Haploplasma axanthum]VEU81024.1 transcriptional regulator SlyA [Haploplasma axanthum]